MKKVFALVLVLCLTVSAAAFAEELIVGTNPEFPPFEYVGDDGEIAGADVDIIKAICEKAGIACTIEAMDFDALIPSLASGKIDCAIAGMSVTEERKQSVDFTDPYFDAIQAIIVKEGSDIVGEADLAGKKIGVQLGTTGDLYVTDYVENAEVSRFNKAVDAVQDVLAGRLDAVVIDDAPASVFVAQTQGTVKLDAALNSGNEQYAIALSKGSELVEVFNKALAELKEDGTLTQILAAYQG